MAWAQQDTGARLVLVGGAIRDRLLQRPLINDWDFLVLNGEAQTVAAALAVRLKARPVTLDANWGIVRLVVSSGSSSVVTIDLANALDNDLLTDLKRRDVTINAIGWDGQQLWDPTGGQSDSATQTVRMVAEANLVEDPLRLLRVLRTGSLFTNPRWDNATLDALNRHASRLWQAAGERIRVEWQKLLMAVDPLPALSVCPALLQQILPAHRSVSEGLAQLKVLHERLSHLPTTDYNQLLAESRAGQSLLVWLRWACLAGPGDPNGSAFKLSRDGRRLLDTLCQPPCLPMPIDPSLAQMTWLRTHTSHALPLVIVQADNANQLAECLHVVWRYEVQEANTPPLLDGHTLMQALHLSPGPTVRQGLDAIRDQQMLGQLKTPAAAIDWLSREGLCHNAE